MNILSLIKSTSRGQSIARRPEVIKYLQPRMRRYGTNRPIEMIYAIQNGLRAKPKCPCCGASLPFLTWNRGYQPYCSKVCYGKSELSKLKREQTVLVRYGVKNVSTITRKQALITVQERYGVLSMAELQQTDHVIEKRKRTSQVKYGVEHHTKRKKERVRLSKRMKASWSSKEGYEKFYQKFILRAAQPDVRKKAQETCLRNHGIRFPFLSPTSLEKGYLTRKSNGFKTGYKRKRVQVDNYVWYVQGYEPFAIRWFLDKGIMPYNIIENTSDGKPVVSIAKRRSYVPDFLVYKDNCENKAWLVEVKSTYTLGCTNKKIFQQNKQKFKAAERNGYKLLLLVFDENGALIFKHSKPASLLWSQVKSL